MATITVDRGVVAASPPARIQAAGALTCTLGIARRTTLRALRTPQVFVVSLVRGAMFLLIFRYVFGGAISSEMRYVDFLVPGFVAAGVLFSGMSSASGVAEDASEGLTDRLRSLPVPRVAVVAGRVVADTGLAGLAIVVTSMVGLAIGFRPSAPPAHLLAAFALCLFAAFAFTWVFVTLGLVAGSVQAAHGLAMLVFPVAFVSSAFVPVESMPGWMQLVADHQPLTHLVNATRALTMGDQAEAVLGHSAAFFAVRSLLWSAAIVVIFAPLAAARYHRR